MAVAGFRHLGLKVVSIALASCLWLVVSGEQTVERALRIPLEFTNLPAQLEVVGSPPDLVEVRVRGSAGSLSRISTGELVAVLDLRSARPGQRLFHLTGADVRAPFGVDVVNVSPSNVTVDFERSGTKFVPIVPGVVGQPADGFVVGTVTATPATVEVVGPEGLLARLTEAITEPVMVDGARGTVTELVNVGVTEPSARLRSPTSARVTVVISAAPVEWTVELVPVQPRNAARPVQVMPERVTLFARGPREAQQARAADFDASVNVEGLSAGEFELPVRIVPPPGVGVTRVEPASVRVRIR